MTDTVTISLIGAIATSATALATAILALINTQLTRTNARQIEATKASVMTLEKNTNSIKDALVKVTGESEFAKGLKMGTDAAASGSGAEIAADAAIKAAHETGRLKGEADEKNRAAAERANAADPTAAPL